MSGILGSLALGTAAQVVLLGPASLSFIGDALISPYRAIGTIIPDVMIEEVDRYELEISQHPITRGSPITDHSYLRPKEVSMRVGWSNSGNYPGYINDVYFALRQLQQTRQPFDLFVGNGAYHNMLFASLVVTFNEESSESALMVQALFREVQIVTTIAVAVPASSSQPSKTNSLPPGTQSQQPNPITAPNNSALNTRAAFLPAA